MRLCKDCWGPRQHTAVPRLMPLETKAAHAFHRAAMSDISGRSLQDGFTFHSKRLRHTKASVKQILGPSLYFSGVIK